MDPKEYGKIVADKVFTLRIPKSGVRKGMKNVEIHISEVELAGIIALAVEHYKK